MNVSELQVGDHVGYSRSHYGTFMEKGFGIVIKINGHGHVYIKPEKEGKEIKVFDKYGNERKSVGGCCLCDAEELAEMIARDEANKKQQHAVFDLLNYLKEHRCGNGRYALSEENKKEIKRLAEAL